ncbi:MAG: porphobilinogen deaminase [Polaromonas sp.]|nr:porphobilinogen deaminase [Polaromonas sp.]
MAAALQNPEKTVKVVIATRESRLAMWQAAHVKALLETRLGWQVELLGMTTLGDQILDRSLSKVGGKGLFVKELETALLDGRADLAVHSLKDVPMDLPEGFTLACVLEREDPHDAFVSNQFASLAELPQGAVVGTSSLRRLVLLKALRPDLRIEPLRGNLDTRLRKLDEGQYQAIVLAAAGLKRLNLASRIRHTFAPGDMLPAAGQGALGIEVRAGRADLTGALATLAHQPTWLAVTAERTVSRAMGGSCSMPLAAFVTEDQGGALQLSAAWGDLAIADMPSGASAALPPLVQVRQTAVVRSFAEAEALGEAVAAQLRAGGAVWAANPPVA